jgi:hypothetical protein
MERLIPYLTTTPPRFCSGRALVHDRDLVRVIGPHESLPTPAIPHFVAAADFNGDGALDLAVANDSDAGFSLFMGAGDGGFLSRIDIASGTFHQSLVIADFNGDGAPDLAVVNAVDNTVSVLLNAECR